MILSPTLGLWLPEGTDPVTDIAESIRESNTILDDAVLDGDSRLLTAALQAALAGSEGTPGSGNKFLTEDSIGVDVEAFGASSGDLKFWGSSVIATTEARTNTAYDVLATPDRVQNVVVPAGGLLVVSYHATWQESVGGAARAAIFIDANQLKAGIASTAAPAVQETRLAGGSGASDSLLYTVGSGLATSRDMAYSGDVNTGQVLGVIDAAQVIQAGTNLFPGSGGPCHIFVDPGTVDVSVQFKATSGSVTAKNRRLYVWTIG